MVKAEDLIKQQKEREKKKRFTFEKIYLLVEKKIILASSNNQYHTWYQIPKFIFGMSVYSIDECNQYIQEKLEKNGFEVEFFQPSIILVKWYVKK